MARRPPAGQFRHTVVIQENNGEGTYDTYGQIASTSTSWFDAKEMRAIISTLNTQEDLLARQIYPTATHRITVDYSSTLNSTGATRRRVRFGSRTMAIVGITNPDEEDLYLELLCGEER